MSDREDTNGKNVSPDSKPTFKRNAIRAVIEKDDDLRLRQAT
jgi:hypothetical protein